MQPYPSFVDAGLADVPLHIPKLVFLADGGRHRRGRRTRNVEVVAELVALLDGNGGCDGVRRRSGVLVVLLVVEGGVVSVRRGRRREACGRGDGSWEDEIVQVHRIGRRRLRGLGLLVDGLSQLSDAARCVWRLRGNGAFLRQLAIGEEEHVSMSQRPCGVQAWLHRMKTWSRTCAATVRFLQGDGEKIKEDEKKGRKKKRVKLRDQAGREGRVLQIQSEGQQIRGGVCIHVLLGWSCFCECLCRRV